MVYNENNKRGKVSILDNIDIMILSQLLNNCRKSDRQIGKEIGISGGSVRARIRKMEESKIIEKYFLKIEPIIMNYGVFYIVVNDQDTDYILKQVKMIGKPFFVVPCIGGITVCSIVVKDNVKEKIMLAKNLMKDIRVLSIFEVENPNISINLTKTDLLIIKELLDDPTKKIDEISKNTKLSTKTVTRCIEKLESNDAFQFTLIYDPIKLRDYIPYAVLVWIDENIQEFSMKLEKDYSKYFLQKPFVTKNQIVLFFYSNDIFKMDEITQRLRKINGIKTVDLFIPMKIMFLQNWVYDSLSEAEKSSKLHLSIR